MPKKWTHNDFDVMSLHKDRGGSVFSKKKGGPCFSNGRKNRKNRKKIKNKYFFLHFDFFWQITVGHNNYLFI